MEYRIQRKVSFIEEGCIDANSIEELKEKMKTETLDWNVDFEFDPTIESIYVFDEDGNEIAESFSPDFMEKDYVGAMNGAIIFNNEEFERYR